MNKCENKFGKQTFCECKGRWILLSFCVRTSMDSNLVVIKCYEDSGEFEHVLLFVKFVQSYQRDFSPSNKYKLYFNCCPFLLAPEWF